MKIAKKVMAAALALSIAGFAAADEWDDFGSDDFGSSSSSESAIAISGSAELTGRVYTDIRDGEDERLDVQDMYTEGRPTARLNFDYSGASSDVAFKLKFDKFSLGDYKEDILDEFTARAYLGNFQIEAGKMKVVWGKGDKVHVIDNFNANDYTDFIMPDYIDRRIAEPMFRLVYSTPSNIKFEGIWTPMMTVDRLAADGIWQPYASAKLTKQVSAVATKAVADAYNNYCVLGVVTGALNSLAAEAQAAETAYNSLLAIVTATGGNMDSAATAYNANAGTSLTGDQFANLLNSAALAKQTAEGAYTGAIAQANTSYGLSLTSAADAVTAYGLAAETYLLALSNSSNVASNLYPNTYSLKYGQAGARTTFTLGHFDLGLSYYYGHFKQPSFNATKVNAYVANVLAGKSVADEDKFLQYDQLQVFGLEFATVIWKFNIRGEGAYYLTEDTAGDNPWIQNNSVQWVAGFDMDMPWTNMNINVQTQGKYILKSDKIKDAANENDVDWNSDDKYISNKVIVDVTDAYNHESIKIDIKGIFEVETKDFLVIPALTIKAADDFSVTASGMLIKTDNENSEFYNFRRNSYGQLSCKYLF